MEWGARVDPVSVSELMAMALVDDPVLAWSPSMGVCALPVAVAEGVEMTVIASRLDVVARWGDGPVTVPWCRNVAAQLARLIPDT